MSHRSVSNEFRDTVIALMRDAGLPAFKASTPSDPDAAKLYGRSAVIDGLPWTVMCRRTRPYDFSTAMRDAAKLAEQNDDDLFAAVLNHHGYGPEDAFAILPLSGLIKVLGQQAETAVVEKAS